MSSFCIAAAAWITVELDTIYMVTHDELEQTFLEGVGGGEDTRGMVVVVADMIEDVGDVARGVQAR